MADKDVILAQRQADGSLREVTVVPTAGQVLGFNGTTKQPESVDRVPYSGATQNVALGSRSIYAQQLIASDGIEIALNTITNPNLNQDTFVSINDNGTNRNAIQIHGAEGCVSFPRQSASRAVRTTNQNVTTATWTKVQFNSEVYDTLGEYDNATNYRFLCKCDGVYLISMGCFVSAVAANSTFGCGIYVNGLAFARVSLANGGTVSSRIANAATVCKGVAGTTYFEGWAFITGTSPYVQPGDDTFFTVTKIA